MNNPSMIGSLFAAMATRQFAIIFAVVGGLVGAAAAAQYVTDASADRAVRQQLEQARVTTAADEFTGLHDVPSFRRHLPFYTFILMLAAMGSAMLAHALRQCAKIEADVEFERRFRKILESVDLLAVGIDTRGGISFCNNALLKATGWRQEDILGKDWFKTFVPNLARNKNKHEFHRVVSGQENPRRYESEVRTQTGDKRLISWNACQMYDALGRVVGIACLGEDITETRASEERLRKLSYATEQCPSVIMIVDTDSRIEYVNPKFEELTGYTLDEMKGKKPSVLKSGETSSAEYDELWQTIRAGREWHGLFHNRKKNGELYWESASISAIRDAEGKITHYLAVKEDVTERIRLEQKVEERNAEIAKTQALAATGRMANMIAHDLRNPLSTIKMGLQMLGQRQSRDWDEEDIETKQLALEQVHYMEEILADLLSYSRPPALTPEWLSISNLLNTTVITTQRYIEKYRAQVNYTCQPELPTLHGDARKLRQAFSNMIVNAVQAMEDLPENEREIEICVELDLPEDGPRIRVEIRDRGHGIAPERMAHLFEPFFTTRAKGTGLGLAIVKNIVDQHQGTVELMPRTGGGTRAVICLPIGPIQCETAAGGPAPKGSKANDFQDANL